MAKKKTLKHEANAAKTDERYSKLLGLMMMMMALYLFVAFVSYLFTWKMDQDIVMHESWGFLFDTGTRVDNMLGRLGAMVSHLFFYNLFGISSFIFVYLSAHFGWQLMTGRSRDGFLQIAAYLIIIVLWSAVLVEFLFGDGAFPVGGSFGKAVEIWLQALLGKVGLFLLFFFSIIGTTIWFRFDDFNISSFSELQFEFLIRLESVLPESLKKHIQLSDRAKDYRVQKKKENTRQNTDNAQTESSKKAKVRAEAKAKRKELELELQEPIESGQQLELELSKDSIKPISKDTLQVGNDDALEIVDKEIKTGHEPQISVTEENKSHVEPYDPTLDLSSYKRPTVEYLETYDEYKVEIDRDELEANKDQIIETLLNYKIEIIKIKATIGPTVTLYEIVPAPGVRVSKIKNLEDDIALSLSALGIRIIAPIPGKGTIGIEVPNKQKEMVALRDLLTVPKFTEAKMDLPIALGKTIANEVFVADLAKMPHLLIAGATGQGKSVGINIILMSLLYKKHPSQVKLVLIDPKKVELSPYSKIANHFLGYLPGSPEPIVTETERVVGTLNSLCIEMEQRYDLMKKAQCRNIKEYNQKFVKRRLNPEKGHIFMPYIVLVIDEFADLIMTAGKEIELPIGRLAQLARAVGIHLIIATQRPSVNIITGVIKANFPARIAFKVSSKIDSRTILDGSGAEQLIGRGDMLLSVGGNVIRLQCAFVDTPEVEKVINHIAEQQGYPEPYFLPEYSTNDEEMGATGMKYSDLDELFEDGARLLVENQHGSTSMLQRRLKLGYNRAGRIMDQMEAVGIVGANQGSKPREVLIHDIIELERYLEQLKSM
ncbi:MAG: S-DNA-T family DNA segregation ATPase FtsK/SpoIIIE [Cognaticolwellia sp.]|jgi:S-DNA-T family DNA segregation ATPase FtsK/SpoIIIE